jgi:hypothetical protein
VHALLLQYCHIITQEASVWQVVEAVLTAVYVLEMLAKICVLGYKGYVARYQVNESIAM